jgi:hypothetical protein
MASYLLVFLVDELNLIFFKQFVCSNLENAEPEELLPEVDPPEVFVELK